jgi:aldehyde dehydrogenase (NAD+)
MSGRTKSFEWRSQQLNNLIRLIDEQRTDIVDALKQDLHKPECETMVMELDFVRNDAVYALNHLKDWMKPQKVAKNLMTLMDDAYIKYEPFGVALIIGAWNYPIQLTIGPMVGALAAGNCVVLKPSEMSVSTAKLLEKICPQYLDKDCVHVVNGAVAETTALLKEHFDYIMYTGNSMVARIIYEAAAKHLTPVTLELGGKSPVYIDESSDLDIVCRRLMWGKFANAGQTCIAPDYVLCNKAVQDPLVEKCKETLNAFYGSNPADSDSFGRIVNARHFNRVKTMLEASGRVAVGGTCDEKNNFIAPTILVDVKPTDPIMQDEIFGPILPIINVKNVEEAIDIINQKEKPLAMYIFSKNKAVVKNLLHSTSSGGVTVNDTLMHPSLPTLPFGGVGSSGMGGYHGKFSFDTFSHKRGCLVRAQSMEGLNDIRYPPYTARKLGFMRWIMKTSPRGRCSIFWTYIPVLIIGILLGVLIKALV